MGLKLRLSVMQFLQFFVWGAWLITVGGYCLNTKNWQPSEFGAIFATMGYSSLVMPALMGIIADRWINSERLYGLLHLLGAGMLFLVPSVGNPKDMFWLMMINMIFYMPTISLSIGISYSALKEAGLDIVRDYPPVRVWGTIGFIAAMWFVNLAGWKDSEMQFYVASGASLVLALYALSIPKCPPLGKTVGVSWVDGLGLRAFSLFKDPAMARFFIFAMLLGAALQLTNMYGSAFLGHFASDPEHATAFAVKNSSFVLSISQISEVLFILTIPFFMRRFGIQKVMFLSIIAWVLRFGLYAYGDPSDGLWMIVLSCVIYGMAFDFFNISGSIFVERQVEPSMRASGQGLFMMMSNGIGAVIGSQVSGIVIEKYFLVDGKMDWPGIWISFAGYAAVIAVLFLVFFRKSSTDQVQSA